MSLLLKGTWLIPAIPIFGSFLVGILLVSFNRTINRLTKPISFFLISSVLLSTAISSIDYFNQTTGKAFDWGIDFASFQFHLTLYLDLFVEKCLSIAGLVIAITMVILYYRLDRKKGYVRFLSLFTGFAGLLFLTILNPSFANLFI